MFKFCRSACFCQYKYANPPAPRRAALATDDSFHQLGSGGILSFFWKALINHTSDRVLPATQPLKTVPRYGTDLPQSKVSHPVEEHTAAWTKPSNGPNLVVIPRTYALPPHCSFSSSLLSLAHCSVSLLRALSPCAKCTIPLELGACWPA